MAYLGLLVDPRKEPELMESSDDQNGREHEKYRDREEIDQRSQHPHFDIQGTERCTGSDKYPVETDHRDERQSQSILTVSTEE